MLNTSLVRKSFSYVSWISKENPIFRHEFHFLNEKDTSFAKIFVFLQYVYIFTSGERCQRVKKGENQSTYFDTLKAARAKAPSHHLCPGTSSPA